MALDLAYAAAKNATDAALINVRPEDFALLSSFDDWPTPSTIYNTVGLPAEVDHLAQWQLYLVLGTYGEPLFLVGSGGIVRKLWGSLYTASSDIERHVANSWKQRFLEDFPAVETRNIPPDKYGWSFTLIRLK